ncbi:MAG TPA: hypothetical protein PKB13_02175, partial [Clostridia bacterium]|nr:hypothetical protein [Clostridia bacterium]
MKNDTSLTRMGWSFPTNEGANTLDVWNYTQEGYRQEDTVTNGNRFLIGNGYMGYRGTVEEWGKSELAAVNLAGVYDRNGEKWREPVNAPNGLFAKLFVNGEAMALGEAAPLAHGQTVNFRHGIYSRDTAFSAVRLQSERIASMAQPHLLACRLTLTFQADGEAELLAGIATDLWDINGPHLFDYSYQTGAILSAQARTGELNIPVAVAQSAYCDFACEELREANGLGVYRRIRFAARAGEAYTVTLFAAVFTGMDDPMPRKLATALCEKALADGFPSCLAAHKKAWDEIWKHSAVELIGCE